MKKDGFKLFVKLFLKIWTKHFTPFEFHGLASPSLFRSNKATNREFKIFYIIPGMLIYPVKWCFSCFQKLDLWFSVWHWWWSAHFFFLVFRKQSHWMNSYFSSRRNSKLQRKHSFSNCFRSHYLQFCDEFICLPIEKYI